MKTNELIICCAFIIIGTLVICAVVAFNPGEETQLSVLSDASLYSGDKIVVQLTTANGTPIANQSIDVKIIDSEGGEKTLNQLTGSDGKASFELDDFAGGEYTLECLFKGKGEYKQSKITSALEIKEMASEVESESYEYQDPHPDWVCEGDTWYSIEPSPGYYELYDKSTGRFIGNGDMPDRHGFHEEGYLKKYAHTVKYRKNGEYYSS